MESPVASIIGTNALPSDVERQRIQDFLSRKLRPELAQREAEVARVRTLLDQLSHGRDEMRSLLFLDQLLYARDEMRSLIKEHKALLSPIRRIPPEILGEIFVHCLPNIALPSPTPSYMPLLLGRICAGWRNIALSTPILWSEMNVSASDEYPKPRVELIKTWLGRSGSCPLSLSLYSRYSRVARATVFNNVYEVIRAFFLHVSRWRHFRFDFQSWYHHFPPSYTLPFQIPQGGAPLLEDIFVSLPDSFKQNLLVSAPGYMPRLHSVHWEGSNLPLYAMEVPWDQLTHLSLYVLLSAAEFFEILRQCQRITHLNIKQLTGPDPGTSIPDGDHGATCLESLCSLRVRGDTSGIITLLSHLELPALLDLDISPVNDGLYFGPRLATFISQSSCHLVNLRLHMIPMSDDDFINLLRYTSGSLVGLLLQGKGNTPTVTDKVLAMCTLSMSEGQSLCPMLESVVFVHCISSADDVLATMVESRCASSPTVRHLKKVVVGFGSGHKDDRRRLNILRRFKGLEVSIEKE